MKLKKVFLLVFSLMLLSSCVKDVDFDQADTFVIDPVIDSSFIFFNEPATSFLEEDGSEASVVLDTVRVEVFTDDFIVDNLVKAEFTFEGINTINRAYTAAIDFLNDDDEIQHTTNLAIPASPTNQPIEVVVVETFEGIPLEAVKNSTQLAFTLELQASDDGTIIDENTVGDLSFRSKGAFYFLIDVIE